MELDTGGLEIYLGSGADALAEFTCPDCGRTNLVRLGTLDVAALVAVGIPKADGSAPFELLEGRSGPPISWDDLLDFHQELADEDVHPLSLEARGPSGSTTRYERDAA